MPRLLIGNIKGTKGDTGAQGERGLAGTIEVGSVQTVSYGSPASVTNSGTEEEAILDFQIPQGAPGAQVTDMSNLVLNTITESTADYPAFAVSETGSTIFGKIRKFLSDLKTKYVSKSMMTTSTNIDTAGQAVADAKAVKSLNDSLANLSTDVSTNYATKTELANSTFQHITVPSDLNSMTTLWRYTDFPFAKTPLNAPYGAGTVYTLGGMSQVQVMFPYDFNQGTKFVFLRTRYSNTWGAWYKVAVAEV